MPIYMMKSARQLMGLSMICIGVIMSPAKKI